MDKNIANKIVSSRGAQNKKVFLDLFIDDAHYESGFLIQFTKKQKGFQFWNR